MDDASGIGLWEAVLHKGDAMDPKSRWTWSPEFRRLVGYQTVEDYPNVVQSWSDRLHPDDVGPTFAAFGKHLEDKSGKTRYRVEYRLKVKDGSYRWFRATGGCKYMPDGVTVRACGSLTDIHDQKMLQESIRQKEEEEYRSVLSVLFSAFGGLADGDLTRQIREQMPEKYEQLKANFNKATASLQEIVAEVASTVSTFGADARNISQATDDLAKRTEQQASSLEETASAMEEIGVAVQNTAQRARELSSLASKTKSAAEESGSVVNSAVHAMSEIENSSEQIGQIIGVIDEIAFQTNLLALNAGVEAARAGEAGKGFAVVAQEVRELAQRSAKAAKEIKALISTSSHQVSEGVTLVGRTGEALQGIVTAIGDITQLIADIDNSAREQSSSVKEINGAISQMDRMTQQNAGMVEETAGASRQLSDQADRLMRLIARFKLHEGHSSANTMRTSRAA
ncbi:PAS domain-containing methyl-accepting chemotaxis protein [Allorhizobium sonneratiae]|uniref:methyl-accepting chemotaxis protein n=1 Tax=Allorhizobium sonneratiae TaxID=2934936 RepID=UPI002033F38A|nr:PAS domain-containing methyl-accepting chemotaxis protein [Allorhizobium sonneratiae]